MRIMMDYVNDLRYIHILLAPLKEYDYCSTDISFKVVNFAYYINITGKSYAHRHNHRTSRNA